MYPQNYFHQFHTLLSFVMHMLKYHLYATIRVDATRRLPKQQHFEQAQQKHFSCSGISALHMSLHHRQDDAQLQLRSHYTYLQAF